MTKIFFDESGQTGAHLMDRNQPYFTIGSTDIKEAEAAEIINEYFPNAKGPELKSRSMFRRDRGRQAFIAFSKVVGNRSSNFCGAKINKRFSIVCKMVDNLVEPLMRATGHDFYADNYAARFANMTYFAFSNVLEEDASMRLLESYNEFARKPSSETLAGLQSRLATELSDAPRGSEDFLSLMFTGATKFEQFHDLADFSDTNDLHLTAVLQCIGFWQQHHSDAFEVFHDESTHFFKRSHLWETMTNPNVAPTTLHVGEKTLKLPINVLSTKPSRSHESASLQLCDLVAGFISFASNPSLEQDEREFVKNSIDNGMNELSIFPIEPGHDFVDGPPRKSMGPDVVDQIIEAVYSSGST